MSDEKVAAADMQRLLSYLLTSILNPNSQQTWKGLRDLIYNAGLEGELKSDVNLYLNLHIIYAEVNQVVDAAVREKILQCDVDVFTFLQRLDAKVMHPPFPVSLRLWKVLLGVPRVDSPLAPTPERVSIIPPGVIPSLSASAASSQQTPIKPLGSIHPTEVRDEKSAATERKLGVS